jgi:hypothetical protein
MNESNQPKTIRPLRQATDDVRCAALGEIIVHPMAQSTTFLLDIAAFLAALALVLGSLLKIVHVSTALPDQLGLKKNQAV